MEDVIQILVFIAITLSVIISKYKEVGANRPGQTGQKPARPVEAVREDEEDFPEGLNRDVDDFEDFDEKFEQLNEDEEEFSPARERRRAAADEEEPVVFDIPSSWKDILGIPSVSPAQSKVAQESKLQTPKADSTAYQDILSRPTTIHSQDTRISATSENAVRVSARPQKAVKEPRIRMKTRSEARRAFIYSEIFNRKYE